ncbi:MAG: D-glycero-alpha-D-manno-heptose-1,7-bisphosphate 7-phosphatase [Desulfonatronovibrionaceae bacterium]
MVVLAAPNSTCRGPKLKIKNIFLDRDGTIIRDQHYLKDPDRVVFLPGALELLARMRQAGLKIYVVTNQSGIARGYLTSRDYQQVHQAMLNLMHQQGTGIDDSMFCPHGPDENCSCRKPAPGMWKTLAGSHRLKAGESIVIGDKMSDLLFGMNSGFRAGVLVLTGKGRQTLEDLPCPGTWSGPFQTTEVQGFSVIIVRDLNGVWAWLKDRI